MSLSLGRKPTSEINVTPLIDVVLVLLIVFMILTPLAEQQMYTRVPEADARLDLPLDAAAPDQVVLTVLSGGGVSLNRQAMSIEEMTARLGPLFADRPSRPLFFNAEDGVRYEVAMRVLDACRGAGVATIGLMTDPPLPGDVPAGAPP